MSRYTVHAFRSQHRLLVKECNPFQIYQNVEAAGSMYVRKFFSTPFLSEHFPITETPTAVQIEANAGGEVCENQLIGHFTETKLDNHIKMFTVCSPLE